MQVYLTEKERDALVACANEWCSMMSDGDEESSREADERLDDGLGSALYKLYNGRVGQRAYEHWAKNSRRKQ